MIIMKLWENAKNKLLIFSLDYLYRKYQNENNKVYYKYHKDKIEIRTLSKINIRLYTLKEKYKCQEKTY